MTALAALPNHAPAEKLLTKAQAAERLACSPRKLARLVAGRELPAYKFGRHVRFKTSDVDAFISHLPVR